MVEQDQHVVQNAVELRVGLAKPGRLCTGNVRPAQIKEFDDVFYLIRNVFECTFGHIPLHLP